jgi:transposase
MTIFYNVQKIKSTDDKKKRDWKVENNSPVRFAEELFLEGFRLMMSAEIELNTGPGRPREYPDAMVIRGMKIMHACKTGYRQTVGIMRGILGKTGIWCISVSQLYHRAKALSSGNIRSDPTDARILAMGAAPVRPFAGRRITLAVDSTGVRPSSAGEWMAETWGRSAKKRGWIKLHAAVDVDTNEILAFVITDENCGDNTCFMMLVDMVSGAGHDVERIYADAAYDAKENWKLRYRGIEFIANIRKDATGEFNGCAPRGLQALRRNEIGEEAWKIEVGYGRRWKVECTFSDFKRMLSETLRSRNRDTMAAELYWKVLTFDRYKKVRKELSCIA